MALNNWTPESLIYNKDDNVSEVSLIIRGDACLMTGTDTLLFSAGDLIGIEDLPGKKRSFSYKALNDCVTYSYSFENDSDLLHILSDNEKLTPTITAKVLRHANALLDYDTGLHQKATEDFIRFKADLLEYPKLCAKAGRKATDFSNLSELTNPNTPVKITAWKSNFISSLCENSDRLFSLISQGPASCSGFLMNALDLLREVSSDLFLLQKSMDSFHHETNLFRTQINFLRATVEAIESGESQLKMPPMEDLLSQIISYSQVSEEIAASLIQSMNSYVAQPDRSEVNDSMRTLRRTISEGFYAVYTGVFKNSLKEETLPVIIKMFLMFGLMDERIVEEEDLKKLFGFAQAYVYDNGPILSLYDWLKMVYEKQVEPSLSEFQLEYQNYLKEGVKNGDWSQEEMDLRLPDADSRLSFEIKNLFALGNRMAFGRATTFVPVFDSSIRLLPLERSYLSENKLNEELNNITDIDYSIFYREKLLSVDTPMIKGLGEKTQLYVHEEKRPYMILFPICGSHPVLWQTIEGRKRNTPARMIFPIFFDDNLTDSLISICGEYRWEVCKTDQGVRWNDITDPSLTAEYNDLLQFYKKNSALSTEVKEKIKTTIKKFSSNYKRVFVADYLSYIKFEAVGNARLIKQTREILYKYAPMAGEAAKAIAQSPLYEKLIELRISKAEQKIRPIKNLIQRIENADYKAPASLIDEIEFLGKQ